MENSSDNPDPATKAVPRSILVKIANKKAHAVHEGMAFHRRYWCIIHAKTGAELLRQEK